jgi:hypothetical protein
MNNMTNSSPAPDLAGLFEAPARDTAAALAVRADNFRRSIAQGGPRDDYERWYASLDALQAALEILEPASRRKPSPFSTTGGLTCP